MPSAATGAASRSRTSKKACALGASYGGYIMNRIEGNWYCAE
jgi:dipeptidyl aminopeptidase/acylaminoacyl peptidase